MFTKDESDCSSNFENEYIPGELCVTNPCDIGLQYICCLSQNVFGGDLLKGSARSIHNYNIGRVVKNLLDKETIREISKDIFYFTVTNVENNILTLNDGKKEIKINYKKCVLCCGGLETTRLLLNSGLKNENLGKYYSPHLSVKKGKCILNKNIRKNSMYSNNISKYFIY